VAAAPLPPAPQHRGPRQTTRKGPRQNVPRTTPPARATARPPAGRRPKRPPTATPRAPAVSGLQTHSADTRSPPSHPPTQLPPATARAPLPGGRPHRRARPTYEQRRQQQLQQPNEDDFHVARGEHAHDHGRHALWNRGGGGQYTSEQRGHKGKMAAMLVRNQPSPCRLAAQNKKEDKASQQDAATALHANLHCAAPGTPNVPEKRFHK